LYPIHPRSKFAKFLANSSKKQDFINPSVSVPIFLQKSPRAPILANYLNNKGSSNLKIIVLTLFFRHNQRRTAKRDKQIVLPKQK